MKHLILIIAVVGLSGCAQPVTPLVRDSPVALACEGGGYCDRRTEVCGQAGHACGAGDCCYVADNGLAFGSRKPRKQVRTPGELERP